MSIRDEVLLNRGSALTEVIAKIWLISNVFIWYFCIFFLFKNIINEIKQDPLVDILIWFANFCGAIASAIISSTLINNYKKI
ncbi:MAG: hypothetical protein QW279_09630, partial [Candidatus Jordarchaeaceae archaeon]